MQAVSRFRLDIHLVLLFGVYSLYFVALLSLIASTRATRSIPDSAEYDGMSEHSDTSGSDNLMAEEDLGANSEDCLCGDNAQENELWDLFDHNSMDNRSDFDRGGGSEHWDWEDGGVPEAASDDMGVDLAVPSLDKVRTSSENCFPYAFIYRTFHPRRCSMTICQRLSLDYCHRLTRKLDELKQVRLSKLLMRTRQLQSALLPPSLQMKLRLLERLREV